jgi:uncharacterized membrane protein
MYSGVYNQQTKDTKSRNDQLHRVLNRTKIHNGQFTSGSRFVFIKYIRVAAFQTIGINSLFQTIYTYPKKFLKKWRKKKPFIADWK